jgi:hypothetical protein
LSPVSGYQRFLFIKSVKKLSRDGERDLDLLVSFYFHITLIPPWSHSDLPNQKINLSNFFLSCPGQARKQTWDLLDSVYFLNTLLLSHSGSSNQKFLFYISFELLPSGANPGSFDFRLFSHHSPAVPQRHHKPQIILRKLFLSCPVQAWEQTWDLLNSVYFPITLLLCRSGSTHQKFFHHERRSDGFGSTDGPARQRSVLLPENRADDRAVKKP